MCVIAYAPSGVTIENATILNMFENNPDGAGIMWKPLNGGRIQIRKGFMTEYELIDAFNQIPVECEKAIHCRIATSGAISSATCHPFPVRSDIKTMRKKKDQTSMALMHNGIISYCTPKAGMDAKHSDTMEFAAQYLFPLRNQIDNQALKNLIKESTNSRLLVFRQNKDTVMLGDWIEDNGAYFSNDTYLYSYWGGYCGSRNGYQLDDRWDGFDVRTSLISIEIPNANTIEEIEDIEQTIFNELTDKGFSIVDMRLDEYSRAYFLELEIEGRVPDEIKTVAGYEIIENYY